MRALFLRIRLSFHPAAPACTQVHLVGPRTRFHTTLNAGLLRHEILLLSLYKGLSTPMLAVARNIYCVSVDAARALCGGTHICTFPCPGSLDQSCRMFKRPHRFTWCLNPLSFLRAHNNRLCLLARRSAAVSGALCLQLRNSGGTRSILAGWCFSAI